MKYSLGLFLIFVLNVWTAYAQTLSPKQDEKKGKWGYVDQSGKWIIKPKYTHASPFKYGVGRVEKDGNVGYVNEKGKELLKCKYEKDAIESKDYLFVKYANLSNTYYLYDLKRKSRRSCTIENIEKTEKGAYIIKVTMEAESSPYVYSVDETRFFIVDKDGNVDQIFNEDNRISSGLSYEHHKGFYQFSTGKLYSSSGKYLLDHSGRLETNAYSSGAILLADGLGIFDGYLDETKAVNGREGSTRGTFLVTPEDSVYALVDELKKPLNIVKNLNGGYKVFYNNMTESTTYEAVELEEYVIYAAYKYFTGKLNGGGPYNDYPGYKLYKDGKWDYCYEGRIINLGVKGSKDDADKLKLVVASVAQKKPFFAIKKENGKVDLYDPTEKKNIVSDCDSIKYLCDEYASCWKDGFVGIFDAGQSQLVIPLGTYTQIQGFGDIFWANINGKRGIISKETYKQIVPCVYDKLYVRSDRVDAQEGNKSVEHVYAQKDGKMGILERKTGKVVVPFRYTSIKRDSELGIYRVYTSDTKFGLFDDSKGKEILPCKEYSSRYQYDNVKFVYNALFGIFVWDKNNKVGVIDFNGKVIVPFAYDDYDIGRNVMFVKKEGNKATMYAYSLIKPRLLASQSFHINNTWGQAQFYRRYMQ